MQIRYFRLLWLLCIATVPLPVWADNSLPEELVVSGYRPVTTFDLDTSVSLLDSETIRQATVNHFEELVQLVPNMYLSGEASRARYFQIRGVGEREQYEGAPNPSVGYFIDDIDLSGIGGVSTTFDLEQVEVLRGPQSARYGASALAGVVYTQSAIPTDELSTRLEATGGSEDTWALGAALGGPMTESLSGRISAHYYEDNGFRSNSWLAEDDTNGREELTTRGKLLWQPGREWEMLLSGLYLDFDNGYDAFAIDNTATTLSDEPGKDQQKTRAASLKLSGPLNTAVDLVSISGYTDSDIYFSFDADWVNPDTWIDPNDLEPDFKVRYSSNNARERNTISQELRLVSGEAGKIFNSTTDWVVGVFVQRLQEDDSLYDPGDYVDFLGFCDEFGDCPGERSVNSHYEADTLALFAALESQLTARWGLSAGLRVERWDADYEDSWFDNQVTDEDYNPVPVDGNNSFSPSENLLGGHAALSYDWNDDLRVYARIARGFKAGGFNPSLSAMVDAGVTGSFGAELVPYDPEYLWNYELGLRGLWFDGVLEGDISVFYMDRDDAQLSQSTQLDNPASFIYVTNNGEAHSYGLEASGKWAVSPAWQVHGTLGLLESKIDEWLVEPAVEGRDLAHAPPYTLNLGATWSNPEGWFARVDINAVGSYYFDISHDQKSDAYEVVNLRAGKDWNNWGVSLWARNLFDEDYATRGFYFDNEPPYAGDGSGDKLYTRFGEPRVFGLTVNYRL